MTKAQFKQSVWKLLSTSGFFQKRMHWGYNEVQLKVLACNFFFQRILRLSSVAVPFSVNWTSRINGCDVQIGEGVGKYLASNTGMYINATGNRIEIGDGSAIASNVGILTRNHDLVLRDHGGSPGPVILGKNCWVGMNCVILPGTTLGANVTVAAGSIVRGTFPDNVIIGGVPAKIIAHVTDDYLKSFRIKNNIIIPSQPDSLH